MCILTYTNAHTLYTSYIHVHIYTYTYTHILPHASTYILASPTYINAYTYLFYMHIYTHVYIFMLSTFRQACIQIHTYTSFTNIYTYMPLQDCLIQHSQESLPFSVQRATQRGFSWYTLKMASHSFLRSIWEKICP